LILGIIQILLKKFNRFLIHKFLIKVNTFPHLIFKTLLIIRPLNIRYIFPSLVFYFLKQQKLIFQFLFFDLINNIILINLFQFENIISVLMNRSLLCPIHTKCRDDSMIFVEVIGLFIKVNWAIYCIQVFIFLKLTLSFLSFWIYF
jgi:hypothetical protein